MLYTMAHSSYAQLTLLTQGRLLLFVMILSIIITNSIPKKHE